MKTMSRVDVSRQGPYRPSADPPAISAAAPRTGSSASAPGNGIDPVSTNAEAMTAPRPSHPSHPQRAMAPVSLAGAMARRPPMPSSHMRVVVTKYAADGFAFVS